MPEFPLFMCLVEVNDKLVLLHDGKAITCWKHEAEAAHYWEDGYNRAHSRGYEASMSACINFIFFHPSVIRADSMEFVKNDLVGENPRLVTCRNISGSITGIVCDGAKAREVFEKGYKPRLT